MSGDIAIPVTVVTAVAIPMAGDFPAGLLASAVAAQSGVAIIAKAKTNSKGRVIFFMRMEGIPPSQNSHPN